MKAAGVNSILGAAAGDAGRNEYVYPCDNETANAGGSDRAKPPGGEPTGRRALLWGLRVAMVTPDYLPDVIGGGGVSCGLLVRHLRERGIIVDVYALTRKTRARGQRHVNSKPAGTSGAESRSRRDIRLPAGWGRLGRNLRAFAALRRRLNDYDLVHVYDPSLLPAAALIHRLGRPRVPVVVHLNNLQGACFTPELCLKEECDRHGWLKSIRCIFVDPEPSSKLRRLVLVHPMFHVVNWLGRLLPSFIAISADVKARYVASGFPAERIFVVPNMLDDRLFAPGKGAEGRSRGAELKILYVGQLDHRKGVHDLLAAYSRVPAEMRARTRLTMLGAGKDESALRRQVRERGIGDRVEIRHCRYEDLPNEYAAADVFVKPACWPEPFGRTCLEALALGLPVLAADVPSAREILGSNALYYRPFDVGDFAARLEALIESDERRKCIGAGAAARLRRYSPSKAADGVLRVYAACRRLMQQPRGGPSNAAGPAAGSSGQEREMDADEEK